MKINIVKVILLILLLVTFFIIFNFSNQTGKESGGISKKITQIVTKDIKKIQDLEETQKKEKLNQIEHIIRKIAHFTIYTTVGILIIGILTIYKIKKNKRIFLTFMIGGLYAILDEIHQAFIPQRTARITDVIIDLIGVMFGMLCGLVIIKMFQRIKNRAKKQVT